METEKSQIARKASPGGHITIFLSGDVMTGRGVDQVLPRPSNPVIHEPWVNDARMYMELAERASGPISKPVSPSYIWGDALAEMEKADLRIINLETAVTRSADYWKGKLNYRMHPENLCCIQAARIDCCTLANNHTLDWGYCGLFDTIGMLKKAGVSVAGAGSNLDEARSPAILRVEGKARVLVFSFGSNTSGIPPEWAASGEKEGVNLLEEMSSAAIGRIGEEVRRVREPGDIIIFSIHWGGNWGYEVPGEQRDFAHALIDEAGVDVIHGHSSHHVKGIEVYRGKPILYGCGDFLSDYEGITGYEEYRADLGLMYFTTIDPANGGLIRLRMVPTRLRRFQVNRASRDEAAWLKNILDTKGRDLGTHIEINDENDLILRWEN